MRSQTTARASRSSFRRAPRSRSICWPGETSTPSSVLPSLRSSALAIRTMWRRRARSRRPVPPRHVLLSHPCGRRRWRQRPLRPLPQSRHRHHSRRQRLYRLRQRLLPYLSLSRQLHLSLSRQLHLSPCRGTSRQQMSRCPIAMQTWRDMQKRHRWQRRPLLLRRSPHLHRRQRQLLQRKLPRADFL